MRAEEGVAQVPEGLVLLGPPVPQPLAEPDRAQPLTPARAEVAEVGVQRPVVVAEPVVPASST